MTCNICLELTHFESLFHQTRVHQRFLNNTAGMVQAKAHTNKSGYNIMYLIGAAYYTAPMTEFAVILLSAVLVNNYVLTKFLGICPFLGVSGKTETAIGMSFAVMFVMTLASTSSWLVQQYILMPLDLLYLQTIFFILIIASLVQFIEMLIHKLSPVLYQGLGIYLPLITTNCAVLGVALLNVQQDNTFMTSALYGLGAAMGFSLVLILFSGLRERMEGAPIPIAFKGAPVTLITAGMMSLAFLGFSGLVKV